ncbi:YdfD/YebW family protein [Biostraticola tofi]|uniref:Uncharacterized protein DUF1482 n=1 Tax=Biostraticola tofi TaxID=466109 RepID=A0A4R3Z3Z8_9GAMM|nr:YebW family protein [Biostraticola tofi]TCW00008.1 uncharacterized protein DUF1482 [Biostraticola tofi]
MYALVLFICYLGQDCDDLLIDAYRTEDACLASMKEQRLRHAGCYPIEDFIDGLWRPAQDYADF